MTESFMTLPAGSKREIIQTAASELGKSAAILEKDIWICWALEILFSIPDAHPMAFKGGTSLSKVYNIIDRFSEDVDITLDYRYFDKDFDPFANGLSKNQIKRFSDELKKSVKTYTTETLVPIIEKNIERLPANEAYNVEVSDDGEKVWVSYPSAVENTDKYLKSQVLLEFGGRNVIDPNEIHTIQPYLSEFVPKLQFPTGKITVLSPARTFWEKATLIHVECSRGTIKSNAHRIARHWYDLVKLSEDKIGKEAILDRKLLEDVVHHKKVFYHAGYANYDACLTHQIKLLPQEDLIKSLELDYKAMIKSGMMHNSPPSFSEIVDSISKLECTINSNN